MQNIFRNFWRSSSRGNLPEIKVPLLWFHPLNCYHDLFRHFSVCRFLSSDLLFSFLFLGFCFRYPQAAINGTILRHCIGNNETFSFSNVGFCAANRQSLIRKKFSVCLVQCNEVDPLFCKRCPSFSQVSSIYTISLCGSVSRTFSISLKYFSRHETKSSLS